jgi:ABC-type transport system substrate-binding protein
VIGTRLADRYELLSELGRGGMGVVYRARDPLLSRDVAIKLITPDHLSKESEERFQREAQVVAQMDHPSIVPIHDFGRHEGSLFFVMPVVAGTTLRRLIREGSLRLGEVLDIGIQVAAALDYSHARGIVHRDIKPENLMIERDGDGSIRARVMDFGLARADSENRLTKTGTLVGTVAYFAPEQVTSARGDGRTDIYALGTVLFECLAGQAPFMGETQSVLYRIVHEVPPSLRDLGADVSDALEAVVLSCLEKDPAKRPERGAQLAEALRRYRSTLHEDDFTRSVLVDASRMLQRPAGAPFVGREKESALLQKRLHAAVAGECQLALVAGEPGIGKTRLLDELANLAKARKIPVLRGRFVEQDRAFAYQGFCELVQDYFKTKESPSGPDKSPDLSDLAPELVALFPVLGEIPELHASGPRAAKPPEDRIAIFELFARTLIRVAGGKPLVLLLENLHGAEASIEALQYVVRRLGPTPALVVGSYRQTEIDKRHPLAKLVESFADDPRFTHLTLGPFSRSDYAEYVKTVVGGAHLGAGVSDRLFEATEGNPFFTKELVRSLLDSGGIGADDTGALQLSGATGISSEALPATIQQAVEKRVERLPEDLRDVLSTASVLGRSFDFRDLESLSEKEADLEDAIDRLVREGLLEEERESRGDRLAFSSGIVRDVLYAAFSRRKRRSLHRRYAELLEKRFQGRLERVSPELVLHFSQGDVADKTVQYALEHARRSLAALSPEDAVRVLKIALEFLEDEEWEGDRGLEGEARLLLAQAHRISGNLDGALREAEAALKVAEEAKDAGRAVDAIFFAADTAWQGRRPEEARKWVEKGLAPARAAGKPEPLVKMLSLAVTLANLRGEQKRGAAHQAEIDRLAKKEHPEAEELPRGGRLVVALANPIAAKEPVQARLNEEVEVLANAYETLLGTDAKGAVVPGLCEAWSLSEDGRAARLTLRSSLRFSDGAPLTAHTVKAAFERAILVAKEGLPDAFTTIRGLADFLDGRSSEVSGIAAVGEHELTIELSDPLPLLPALLTDARTAVARLEGDRLLGTGPFRFVSVAPDVILLARNPEHPVERQARIDELEFKTSMSASAIASSLRAGQIDVARDLLPEDLDGLLRDPRFRSGLVETPKKGTFFALFGPKVPSAARQSLSRVLRVQDLVFRTLGRFAIPATGLIPPGILGHDPGRRLPHVTPQQAAEALHASHTDGPLKLEAAVHPLLQDRYRALLAAMLAAWREIGVEVSVVTKTMPEYLACWNKPVDLLLGRWIADYDDPDNFSFSLFHTQHGHWRSYFSSEEMDRLFEEGRLERRPPAREAIYRRFENALLDDAVLIPLFHELDYRLSGPSVAGLALKNGAPFINFTELAKRPEAPAAAARAREAGGTIQITRPGSIWDLDPAVSDTFEHAELLPNAFDTLTRAVQGAVQPWLASEVLAEDNLVRYRIRLRPGVRFHDGRRVTARDVRFSFERLLQSGHAQNRWYLSFVRGAKAMIAGETLVLSGFHIVSPTEFVLEMEEPVSFFPTLLSYPALAILPEGTETMGASWKEGTIGTGPFRIVRFVPGRLLELERNPLYWREGLPKIDGVVLRFGAPPAEVKGDFVTGRSAMASDLLPSDAEALRHDPAFASSCVETPNLATYFIALNTHKGPMSDPALRRRFQSAVDAPGLVKKTLGRLAVPAHGLIPPGLLGHGARAPRGAEPSSSREVVELTASVNPIYFGPYAAFYDALLASLREKGFIVRSVTKTMPEFLEMQQGVGTDVSIARWVADFPDADTFVSGILATRGGIVGGYCGTGEADALAARGRAESDAGVRHGIYREVEEIVAKDALLVPLFHDQLYRFGRPELEGLNISFSPPYVDYSTLSLKK